TITVEDSTTRTDSQIIFFNLTNINDDPQIINYSIFSTNTHSNIYYNDLTAYTSLEFNYRINATDIDNLTYAGDTLNFTTNATSCSAGSCPNFTINLDNGMINFTPNSTYIGNHSYLVFVTDLNNSIVNVTIDIEIIGNSYPYYNESLSNQIAYEDSLFTYDVNATDADDNFDVYSDNSTLVNISSSTGIISFTPICSNVGNHSIEITINDTFKAENITSFNLEIINSNDNPSIAVISSQLGIENSPYELDISLSTTDEDITCGSGEILTYTDNTTIFDIDSTSGLIDFIPQNSDIGNNSINITVTDLAGAKYSTYFDFEIRRPNNPPIMYNITAANSTDLTSWYNKSYFPNNISSILIQENTTVIFNHTTIDPEGDTLVYVWYDDGTIINRTVVLNYNFSYNTSGTKNISLSVQENISGVLSNLISFEWNITINESNRIPLLVNPIPNQTGDDEITGTIKKRNFLIGLEENRFFDPDGDNLTFNYSNTTTHIELTLEGANVSFAPQTVGVDYVIFYAKDSQSEWIPSNNVTINVTFVPENEGSGSTVDTETTTNTITRTKTKTRTEIQIIREEIEKIKEGKIFFDLIIPKQITIYKNNTVTAPIWLENNDNITLTGIDLYAISNITDYSDDVDISFTKSDFDELKPGQREETEIIITSYKTFSNYEIFVYGNVSEPEYKDKAVLYINSIEKTKGNQSVTNTKITFARDLLSSNSECLELNEFLLRSQKLIEAKDYEEAAKIIDSVIQGCKYLISKSNLRLEQPTGAIIRVDFSNLSLSDPLILIIASVVVIFSTFSAIAVFGHKKK
ncbi:hypothetical protein HN827_01995, partial [archaeon]|nr:hypothetical protein [archaeon]